MTANRSVVLQQHVTQVYVVLVEIDHPMLVEPIRIVNDDTAVSHGGFTWKVGYAIIKLPSTGEADRSASLTIQNVDNRIGLAAQRLVGPATVKFRIVRTDNPSVIEVEYPKMKLSDIRGDANSIEANLDSNHSKSEPYPYVTVNKDVAPGVYV
jgi:hypothetical protein